MRRVFSLLVFLGLLLAGMGWATVIVDVRNLKYPEILSLVSRSNQVVQAIWIGCPLKGYMGDFLPTVEVYDFEDLGNVFQRGSRGTFLGSKEEFERVLGECSSGGIQVYATVRLFQQREGFLTNVWEMKDFYPDYTVALERSQASAKLKRIVDGLKRIRVTGWVVDMTGLPRSYQKMAFRWLKENFSQAFVLGDEEEFSTISSLPFARWQRMLLTAQSVPVPLFDFQGVYSIPSSPVSSEAMMYYFLARQKKLSVVVPLDAVSLYKRIEDVSPESWRDLQLSLQGEDFLVGVSSRGIVSFYKGERVRFTNTLSWRGGNLRSVFGDPYLRKDGMMLEFLVLPWSFSLWTVER